MSPVGAEARHPAISVRTIRLGFLGRWPFRYQQLRFWALDFLGFSRAKRDLSMGYAEKASKSFSWRFCRSVRGAPLGFPGLGMRKRRTLHGEILPQFRILCNRLSPEPFLSAGSTIDSPLDDRPAGPISSMAYLRNDGACAETECKQTRPSPHLEARRAD